jgi:SAM-dependent methyltransferase
MSHREQSDFLLSVKEKFPDRFKKCDVLDIGSLDINGNNLYLFSNFSYVGVDIGEGKNVDVVCRGHEFECDDQFDVVISTECFEHDEFWEKTFKNMIKLCKPGGLVLFTCATTGRQEHGTRRTTPQDSPFTSALQNDYYQNLTELDFKSVVDFNRHFSIYEFSTRDIWPQDLYFWGIKKK